MLGFPDFLAARGNNACLTFTLMRSTGAFALGVGSNEGKGETLGNSFIYERKRERDNVFLNIYSLFCFLHLDLICELM